MNQTEGATGSATTVCEICAERNKAYTCPRCGRGYCSSKCYKSESHLECSESFYKQCVEDELRSQDFDPENKNKMIEILKRINEDYTNDPLDLENQSDAEAESELDSDDENIADLEARIQNVDLDNPDELWSALTDTEKQQFDALVKNGEVEKLLPTWVAWWTYLPKRKLIEAIDDTNKPDDYLKNCPAIIDVDLLNEVKKASPNVKYNIANVLYAYTYIALYYNGDYMSCPEDAITDFFSICRNITDNEVYNNISSAWNSVIDNIKSHNWIPHNEEMLSAMKQAANLILKGPEERHKDLYICAALSELHRLSSAARKLIKSEQKTKVTEFSNLFTHRREAVNIKLSKKTLFLCCKKLEYYISWAKTHNFHT